MKLIELVEKMVSVERVEITGYPSGKTLYDGKSKDIPYTLIHKKVITIIALGDTNLPGVGYFRVNIWEEE